MQLTHIDRYTDIAKLISDIGLGDSISASALTADILIVPLGYNDAPYAFPQRTDELFQFCQENNLKIEILVDDDKYEEIELNSHVMRLGKIIVKDLALPLFISVLGAYIYENTRNDFDTDEVVEFVAPTEVEFEMEVIDSLQQRKSMTFKFKGEAKEFTAAAEEIKKIWDEH